MATVNFLYRSNKPEAKLTLRLLFRISDLPSKVLNKNTKELVEYSYTDFVIAENTKISVSKDYYLNKKTPTTGKIIISPFNKVFSERASNDVVIRNKNKIDLELQEDFKAKLKAIETFILDEFEKYSPTEIDKKWLTTKIDNFYNPKKNEVIPTDLVSFFDYYINFRLNGTGIGKALLNKNNTIRDKLKEMQSFREQTIYIKDVNEVFMNEFINYWKIKEGYKHNTTHREWGFIKTVCRKARYFGLEVSHQLEDLKFKAEPVKDIQFSEKELERVKNTIYIDELYNTKKYTAENLEIAKDWFIISAHCGQRISDFMRFTTEVITTKTTTKGEKNFLEFTQKKTNKLMVIPILPEVTEILNKRNGNFPPKMFDQEYNEYLKVVCKQAGIDELIYGGLMIEGRKVDDYYKKYKLATSKNCGRRTFATNYDKELTAKELQNFTGHTTEKMLLVYINKENDEIAIRTSEKLDKK
jgi:integrase